MNTQFKPHMSGWRVLIMLPVLFIVSVGLSSCATLKKGDCLQGDWTGIGIKDGTAGRRSAIQFEGHTRACAAHGVSPDKAQYDAGYQQGLRQFCTKTSGYAYGVEGKQYHGVCPASAQTGFLSGYRTGLDVAMLHLASEIRDLRHQQLRLMLHRGSIRHTPPGRDGHDGKDRDDKDGKDGKGRDKSPGHLNHRRQLEDRIDDLDDAIDSRRNDIRRMKIWQLQKWPVK